MRYVDGYVIPVPKRKLAAYMRIAQKASKIWLDHGAIEVRECAADDLKTPCGMSFLKGIGTKRGETVVFSWIVYKSRAQRDRVNAKVMKDPRVTEAMGSMKDMPFDMKRMIYGGFKAVVDES